MITSLATIVDDPVKGAPFLEDLARETLDLGARLSVTVLTAAPMIAAEFAPLGTMYLPEADLEADARAEIARVRELLDAQDHDILVRGVYGDVNWLAHDMHKTDDIVDLLVVGAPSTWAVHWLRRRAIETLLLGSGIPLLLLPEEGRLPQIDRAVLGWRPSAESIRMARDLAMLAEPGAHIDIVTIGEPAVEGTGHPARCGIADFFTAHGFETECHSIDDDRTVEEQLQDFALAARADVLAVGGFGHSRIREIILGGVTHALVAAPRLPILLSH